MPTDSGSDSADDRVLRLLGGHPPGSGWPPGELNGHDLGIEPYGERSPGPRFGVAAAPARAAAVLAVIVVGVCAWLALRSSPHEQALPARSSSGAPSGVLVPSGVPVPSGAPGSGGVLASGGGVASGPMSTGAPGFSAAAGPAALSVYVVGQVRSPGVVNLAAGARVVDAVAAAGGATERADLTAVNLARRVSDGEQIFIPKPGQAIPAAAGPGGAVAGTGGSAGPAAGSGGSGGPVAPVDLNSATAAQLDALPGVGPVIASRIVQWRNDNGRFTSVDQLGDVSGIGDATLAKLRPLVTV